MRKFKITNMRKQGMLLPVRRKDSIVSVPLPGRRITEIEADDLDWSKVEVMKHRGYVEVEEILEEQSVVEPEAPATEPEPQEDESASSATSVEKEPEPEQPASSRRRRSGKRSKMTDDQQ